MSTALQLNAAEQALGISLPHRRMEDWRWTDLRARINWDYKPFTYHAPTKAVGEILSLSPFHKIAKARIAFVDGELSQDHCNFVGLEVVPFVEQAKSTDPIIVMNAAMKPQKIALKFSGNVAVLTEIIHITTSPSKQAIGVHKTIEVVDGASASIVESFWGFDRNLVNSVTEFYVGKNARLDRLKFQDQDVTDTHLAHTIWNLSEGSRLNDVTVTRGAQLSRENGTCNFNGQNAEAKISGAYLLKGKQHADTCLTINHLVPHCTSRELFKCVMDDNARGIFQGKVIVAKDAQKTDGKQSSHALLLSESAEFDAKPELEIYADDVVCGHGATAGDLNHDHLFYLKSRGIPEAEAKSLLISAFVGEAFDMVANDDVREALVGLAQEWVTGK